MSMKTKDGETSKIKSSLKTHLLGTNKHFFSMASKSQKLNSTTTRLMNY